MAVLAIVISVVAVLISVLAVIYTRRQALEAEKQTKLTEGAQRQAAEDARRAQANQISAWFDRDPNGTLAYHDFGAQVGNGSSLAIYDVSAEFTALIASPAEHISHLSDGALHAVPPGAAEYLGMAEDSKEFFDSLPSEQRQGSFAVTLRFRDAAGVRWERRPDGELVELP